MSGSISEAEVMRPKRVTSAFLLWLGPVLIALAAGTAVMQSLDGVGEVADARNAPGLTLDELFNIDQGIYLWRSLLREGPALWTPAGARRVFDQPAYNPDHPPLGRVLIGLSHDLTRTSRADAAAPVYSLVAARRASAVEFALTVAIVGGVTARWYGATAGWIAAASLALLPRLFAHGHLAALETPTNLMFTLAVLALCEPWGRPSLVTAAFQPLPGWRSLLLAGGLFGAALLTKVQAILLPAPVVLWCVWRWGWRGVLLWGAWLGVGVAVWFAAWPWLWLDPVGHALQYLGRTVQRPTIYCYYLGVRYADIDVPWHYPLVMFAVTVPVGLQVLGLVGAERGLRAPGAMSTERRDPRCVLVGAVVLAVLTVFALPRTPVYDGERLFLVVFPLWAILIGRGAALVDAWLTRRFGMIVSLCGLVLVLLTNAAGVIALHPCQLSYYNLLVGGLRGANQLGFEPTYWRDSFTREFLDAVAAAVPAGATLYQAPVLHPANRVDLELLSPILQRRRLRLDAYDDGDPTKTAMRYVLVFRRHADPWAALEPVPVGARLLAEVVRDGVQLAGLYDLRPGDLRPEVSAD